MLKREVLYPPLRALQPSIKPVDAFAVCHRERSLLLFCPDCSHCPHPPLSPTREAWGLQPVNSCLPKYQRHSTLAYSLFLSRGLWTNQRDFSEKENSMESLGSRLLKENNEIGTSSRLLCPIKEIVTFLSWLWPYLLSLFPHLHRNAFFNSQKRGYYHQDADHRSYSAEGSSGGLR